MDARVMAVLNCLPSDMEVFADETGKAPAPPEGQDAASKGLLPTAKRMLGLRCWALLHTPDLTDLEQDLGLLIADANSSELDAELHARILHRYSKVSSFTTVVLSMLGTLHCLGREQGMLGVRVATHHDAWD